MVLRCRSCLCPPPMLSQDPSAPAPQTQSETTRLRPCTLPTDVVCVSQWGRVTGTPGLRLSLHLQAASPAPVSILTLGP